jgi:ribosome-associated protein
MLQGEELANRIVELADELKAQDMIILDVRDKVSYADFLVIASGTSDRHVQSIAEQVAKDLKEAGTRNMGIEGLKEGNWVLTDYGDVVFHVFHHFTREVYRLEEIWQKPPKSNTQS